jgi:hypothetical protein
VIIAMMIEFAVRIVMKRPTVALTCDCTIPLLAKRPTRASEPRTEMTVAKEAVGGVFCISAISSPRLLVTPNIDQFVGEKVKLQRMGGPPNYSPRLRVIAAKSRFAGQ